MKTASNSDARKRKAEREVVHACPPDDSGLTACCGRTPFELPRTHRLTTHPSEVTCKRTPSKEPDMARTPHTVTVTVTLDGEQLASVREAAKAEERERIAQDLEAAAVAADCDMIQIGEAYVRRHPFAAETLRSAAEIARGGTQ